MAGSGFGKLGEVAAVRQISFEAVTEAFHGGVVAAVARMADAIGA